MNAQRYPGHYPSTTQPGRVDAPYILTVGYRRSGTALLRLQLMKIFALIAGLSSAVTLLAVTATASAQPAGQVSAVSPYASNVEGPGIKIGEGTVFHPIFGAETGAISNVFFSDTDPAASGILRLLFEGSIGSLSQQRRATSSAEAAAMEEEQAAAQASLGDLEYRAQLNLRYNEYLSGNNNVTAQRDLDIGARINGTAFPQRTWQFGFDENFQRLTRTTNYESRGGLDRDVNSLKLALRYMPKSRSINGALTYTNTIDVFESNNHAFANRFQNSLALRVNWQFLPVTKFYADAQIGIFTGLGAESEKVTSLPLRTVVGAQTAITTDTTVATYVGYGRGFYTSGADFQNVLFGANFGYRHSPLGRVSFLYDYNFQDSINSNYLRDHTFKVSAQQQIVPFSINASAEVRLRQYQGLSATLMASSGLAVRDDVIFAVNAGGNYNFRDWLAATVDYHLTTVSTDFTYQAAPGLQLNPGFVRHELIAGIRAAL